MRPRDGSFYSMFTCGPTFYISPSPLLTRIYLLCLMRSPFIHSLSSTLISSRPFLQALEVSTVGGVFLMLTLGIGVGFFLLFLEHVVYRYALPSLRTKPKESVWRNRNLMFFSQVSW